MLELCGYSESIDRKLEMHIKTDGTEVVVKSGEYHYFICARREFSINWKTFYVKDTSRIYRLES